MTRPGLWMSAAMPEMPEVETIVRHLLRAIRGRTVSDVRLSGLPLRRPVDDAFAAVLRGRKIAAVRRRGKYIVLRLEPPGFALIHLGMSGRVLYRESAYPPGPHAHGAITFTDGSCLEYRDPRRFGLLAAGEGRSIPELRLLGREPLGRSFGGDWLWRSMSRSRRDVKSFLLDQGEIAGLGNIYACEALFHAKIHPARPCRTVTRQEASRLARSIRKVLRAAIRNRGTTFSDFAASDGRPGGNQRFLRVFQREGRRCRRCRCLIRRMRQSNRSTYYCPVCQS